MTFSPVHRALLLSFLCAGALGSLPRHGAGAAGEGSYITVSTASFASGSTCHDPGRVAPQRNGTSAVLRLTHRHGPCNPSWTSSQRTPSFLDTLRADQRRAEYIERRISGAGRARAQRLGSSKSATVPANLGFSIGTLQYVVTVSLGTPAVAQTVEVDTGSDVSWVQCKPCPLPACYGQKDPLFDPTQSSSYSAVPCGAAACSELGIYAYGCSGAQCGYVVSYGDGSSTTGVYSSDTLTLTGSDALKGFLFGCGHAQAGLFSGVDGLLGLGRQELSLVSQASSAYGGVFSYCLPPTQTTTGYLTLGGPSSTSGFSTTALLSASNAPTFYMVMLSDADHHGVPDSGRAEQHVGVLHDGAAVGVERADVLHGDALRHQRRRAAAGHLGVGVLGGHGGGHGNGGHAAAAHGVRSAAVGVPQRHGPLRLPDRAGDRDPGHVLQLQRVRKRDAADGGADVQRWRDHESGGVGDPVERVPRVRAQQRRRQRGHPRERAAALVRGALRRQHRRVHARFLLIERFINS